MKFLHKHIILAACGLAFTASSCVVGKKYQREELHVPNEYRETAALTGDTVLLPYRQFFQDPALVALIEKALSKNNDVAVAMMSMEQLELSYKQAKKGLLPTVDFSAGANRNWLSKNSLNGSLSEQFLQSSYMDDYSATIKLSWEADIWGKVAMQKEDAKANYFAQKENLSALKTRIIVQVAQAYYNLLALDEQLKVAERNVLLGDSTLSMIRLQYNSAQVNSLAVEQAEAQKKTAELLIPLAQQNIAIQENALSILCGSYPAAVERANSIVTAVPSEVFPSGVPTVLLSRRPDVKAAEYAVVSANAKTGLAKANMYPTISLSPSIGANSFKLNSWFDLPGSLVKNVGVNLAQPVFQKRQLRTAYEIAQIEQQKAAVQFKQSVMVAVGEVSDALAKSKHADERLVLVEKKTASLQKATNDAMLLYRSGMATYLEVITAQNNALQNQLEAISIKVDKLNAVTELYRALGGGVEE
ncbi:NodT family efflux transporter outer membrane factor (OMF) lipoprotein [Chitinophaga skermanii]|uniref:NodT family efflux transporter outer membrane factor (OMF) lipoprotein n=1 Tax=Chitinophaga skermanii TaxID=331697 RepID=A0A327QW26_9BACT|nr:efflux transporter outer membrane subunit [Chitinophaga skermanii]RAJ08866.1 NodT family efflux transporter outer membrane factor (OMF) lipoprotein [Chitinophaga skermanii]